MKKQIGFTLIELMIVVAIIGVLASVAIPSFLRFVKKSKISEASINMSAIIKGAISWYNTEHSDTKGDPMYPHFPHYSSPSEHPPGLAKANETFAPSDIPCGTLSRGSQYIKNTQTWQSQPWLALNFSINKSHYFQYYWSSEATSAFVEAIGHVMALGDLDCDGTLSSFITHISINENFSANGISQLIAVNELE